ncbi:MAG: FAD:protein FMN transferase [Saprospiraceae bacterium]|nr:FAD:protein FMN transferase [Saprospiraceae bacterium]
MKNLSLIILIAISSFACNTANKKATKIIVEGEAQGTTYSITYYDINNINYSSEFDSILDAFDKSVSIYDSLSIISKVNSNDHAVVLDEIFIENFKLSKEINIKTNDAFDMTVGPLVNAWGFGFKHKEDISQRIIDSLLEFVGSNNIWIEGGKIIKLDPRVQIDFNAIAQGYSVGVIAKFLESRGIENYLVEIGGEVIGKGKKDDGEFWRVGIDKPIDDGNYDRELQAIIYLKNKALATSGNYRKFYIKDGVKYSHTIDPKTGYPVQHSLLSATVIADDCAIADALATSFMVMGLEKAKQFLASNKEIEAYLIYSNISGKPEVFFTEGFKEIIVE